MSEEHIPDAQKRPYHGGYPRAYRSTAGRSIMLEIVQAQDAHEAFARRLTFLKCYFASSDLHFADQDGEWSMLSFLRYYGEVEGWTDIALADFGARVHPSTTPHPPPDRVELVARIIDPEAWKNHDDIAGRTDDREWFEKWKADSIRNDGRWGSSLAKARQVLAAIPTERQMIVEVALAWQAFKRPYLDRFAAWPSDGGIEAMQTLNRILMPIAAAAIEAGDHIPLVDGGVGG